jgi:RNA polymerase sigma factor (sigma-70 family)
MLVLEKGGGRPTGGDAGKQLVDRALAGDAHALRALIAGLTPVVRRRVTSVLARMRPGREVDHHQEAQDLTQDVLLNLFQHGGRALKRWDPDKGASLPHFVGLIARRQAVSALRGQSGRSRGPSHDLADLSDELPSDVVAPDDRIASWQALGSLLDGLRVRLSPFGLDVFRRLFVDQESVDQICAAMSMTPNAVYIWRARLRRATSTLLAGDLEPPRCRRIGARRANGR